MDNKEITSPRPTQQTGNSNLSRILLSLFGLIILVGAMGAVYFWQHQEVSSLNAQVAGLNTAVNNQKDQVADREKALSSLPNKVVDVASSPIDLIAFLAADNTQCYKQQNDGYFKVLAQANDQFAEMQYGCTTSGAAAPSGTPAYILAKKVSNKWQLISPTNQWWVTQDGQPVPSCTMVNDNKVSKLVATQCFVGDLSSPLVLQSVTNP